MVSAGQIQSMENGALVPWQGEAELMVDRFDGRMFLDQMDMHALSVAASAAVLTEEHKEEEETCR